MQVEIIAELGQGFEGCPEQAKLLVKAAAKAGANAAKFQLVYADELATPDYEYYELFSNLEMEDQAWCDIKTVCDEFGIELILDVFGETGLKLAEKIEVKSIKLHATDINNIGFLKSLAKSSINRIMLGAGGAHGKEILNAIKVLGDKEIVLFHGFQGYPTLIEDNQVSRLQIWAEEFAKYSNVTLGFSDHADPESTTSISLPAFAIGLGAKILEKHLTLGCCMELEDHESAMNPDKFKIFVDCMKDIELAYGSSDSSNDFGMSKSESMYRLAVRRHVVAIQDISTDKYISHEDVGLKRTSSKTPCTDLRAVYGKKVKAVIRKNLAVTEAGLK